jgi:hypothetical protein
MIENHEYQTEPIDQKAVEAFAKATMTEHSQFPLTFPTRYRQGEFEILNGLNVDFRQLLHSEQEYCILKPLEIGDVPVVRTCLKENKTKRGIQFVTVEMSLICGSVTKVTSLSTMVIRVPQEGGGKQ